MFCKKGVLRNFAKFEGKHLCQSLKGDNLLPPNVYMLKANNRYTRKKLELCSTLTIRTSELIHSSLLFLVFLLLTLSK